eukprot:12427892-Karenia_brevis.AAC.1
MLADFEGSRSPRSMQAKLEQAMLQLQRIQREVAVNQAAGGHAGIPSYTDGTLSPKSQNHPHPTLGTPPPQKRPHTSSQSTQPQPFQGIFQPRNDQHSQTQVDATGSDEPSPTPHGYPRIPPLDIMPPTLTIPKPQDPPQAITPSGQTMEEQLQHLYSLTQHLNTTVQQQGQTISQLTHNTHNLYNVSAQHHSTLEQLHTKTNKIIQQLAISQEHQYSNSLSIRHYDSPNYTKFRENNSNLLNLIQDTRPLHQHFSNKQLFVYYNSPDTALQHLKALRTKLPPKTSIART